MMLLKRGADVVVAAAMLLALTPLLVGISAVILLTQGRPVLFRQTRTGRAGVPFTLVKFRTMAPPRADGAADDDAARLTGLGRVLRASSLDELPQLVHVLWGQMSLVGPRPLLPDYLELYSDRQRRRLEVRPGITGLAQVSGRNALSWDDRLELDVRYVETWSLGLDLRILARTVGTVLGRHGVAAEGSATMPRFTGSTAAPGSADEPGPPPRPSPPAPG